MALPVTLKRDSSKAVVPLGHESGISIDSTAGGIGLPMPPGATRALVQVFAAPIRYWIDGQAPTTTKGLRADVYDIIVLESGSEIAGFRGIRETGVSATVEVQYSGLPD